MIDEELYQQAAAELNTDRRRAHIWARACALASDDHDEARFLYTNLRVEELIAERDAGGSPAAGINASSQDDILDHDTTLALEPENIIEDLGDAPSQFDNNDDFLLSDTDDISTSTSTRTGVDSKNSDNNDDLLELLPTGLDLESPLDDTAELDSTSVIDMDSTALAEFQASLPAEEFDAFNSQTVASMDEANDAMSLDSALSPIDGLPDIESLNKNAPRQSQALQQNNDDLSDLLDDVYPAGKVADNSPDNELEGVLTADFSDASGTQAILVDDDLDWLDDEVTPQDTDKPMVAYQSESAEHDDTDRFTQELERQADEMPGQQSDVVAHEVPGQPDMSPAARPDKSVRNDVIEPESDIAAAATAAAATIAGVGAATAAAASNDKRTEPAAASSTQAHPQDLSGSGSGTHYSVYRRDQNMQAVKEGVSWSALIMTLPFLIYRQLFGTAIMYTIMSAILLTGTLVLGLAWFDAGISATPLIKGGAIGFALLSVIGLFFLPFQYANSWRGDKLENRGFELIAEVRAKNPGKAIAQARRAAALD